MSKQNNPFDMIDSDPLGSKLEWLEKHFSEFLFDEYLPENYVEYKNDFTKEEMLELELLTFIKTKIDAGN